MWTFFHSSLFLLPEEQSKREGAVIHLARIFAAHLRGSHCTCRHVLACKLQVHARHCYHAVSLL